MVKFWDAATGQPLRVQLDGPADNVDRAVLSPDGTHLAATRGSGGPTVLVWDLATGGLVTLEGPATQRARGVGFSPDGKRLVCAYRPDDDGPAKDSPRSIRIWDLVTRRAVVSIDRPPYVMSAPAFSPDGRLLAVNVQGPALESHGEIKVWDAATGHERIRVPVHPRALGVGRGLQPGRQTSGRLRNSGDSHLGPGQPRNPGHLALRF